jgi:hypothetical protein
VTRPRHSLRERDEDGKTLGSANAAGDVPLAGHVLSQHDRARPDLTDLAVARLDLRFARQRDDELAARRGVPVKVLVRQAASKDDAAGWNRCGILRAIRRAVQLDVDVLEMALALGVGIDAKVSQLTLLTTVGRSARRRRPVPANGAV